MSATLAVTASRDKVVFIHVKIYHIQGRFSVQASAKGRSANSLAAWLRFFIITPRTANSPGTTWIRRGSFLNKYPFPQNYSTNILTSYIFFILIGFCSASLLSELYCQQNLVDSAKPLLRKAIQISQQTPYWHCRLLFQLAQLHTLEKDLVSACDLLGVGAEYARVVGSEYTRALFLLSKGMLLLMERKLQEVHPLLTLCGQIVENWQGNPIQKESLRVFFLVLQVTHYLDAGQVKSVKPCLKQLQQCIQTISTLHFFVT
ncbi:hypothetical protein GJAV_G00073920 [Gymnothorax javanicus]|nr:hypothetical protein GJAV_G00073920 [Gymnothorax javanicus]